MDAGVGDVRNEMFVGGELLNSMRTCGVEPTEVDTVIISHLHSDHIGWLVQHGKSVFSNANIHLGAADWEYFVVKPGGGEKRQARLLSVEDQVSLVDRDGITLAPGITTRLTPGHTPGHLSSVIASGTDRLIVLGDALHCVAQLVEPEWQFFYDVDRDLASQTRAALLREAEDPPTSLLPCHFPGMAATRLINAAGKRQWLL
jgi:glyoxylase-like metal-dependent hydrolase (beta-lactamase superfamily II)